MLKIEVIKFEAQDVITTSGTPVAPAEPKCTCNSNENHRYYDPETKEHYWNHGNCPMTGKIDHNDHDCISFIA